MNVAFPLLTLFPGQVGGVETYVRGLLESFPDVVRDPDSLLVLTNPTNNPALAVSRGRVETQVVSAYRPGKSALTRLAAMESARLRARSLAGHISGDFDVIHYPVTVPIPSPPNVPRIVTIHDTQHLDMPSMFSRPERVFRRWSYDSSAMEAHTVIADSHFAASRISQHYNIAPESVRVIHCGIDHAMFNVTNEIEAVGGLPDRFIYYPANRWPHKNHDRLLEALSLTNDPDLALVITGREMRGGQSISSHKRVIDLGHVSRRQVAALYRKALAMVFPSLYEGFGFPPLEAMASGCPVAASDIPALREVCGGSALMFDPTSAASIATAIDELAADASLRSDLAAKGLAHAASFTWERSAAEHYAVYRSVVDSSEANVI